jgi:cyclopropane fatty-acyl-phospholipid synthase-like methyltransferase
MRPTFHRIAYEALDVCNAVEMTTLEAAVARTGLSVQSRALDIGSGNGAVAIRLAERFEFEVTAVELDPAMVELARERIAASASACRIILHEARSDVVLEAGAPFDLIAALGTTEPIGGGVRDPRGMLRGLARRLSPGGWLLWGDLVWLSEPSQPLRQIVELNNSYADHAGWQTAAQEAGGLYLLRSSSEPPRGER